MAYTRAWDAINWLLGSRDADEIDDAVRELGLDLHERLSSVLVDPADDPWVLKSADVVTVVHWSEALVWSVSGALTANAAKLFVAGVSDAFIAHIPITLPKGSTLKGVIFRVIRSTAGATMSLKVSKVDSADVITDIASADAVAGAGAQDVDMGALAETLGDDERFVLRVTAIADGVTAASIGFFFAKITADHVWGS